MTWPHPVVLLVALGGAWYFGGNARRAFGRKAKETLRAHSTGEPVQAHVVRLIRLERARLVTLAIVIPLGLPSLLAEALRAPKWVVFGLLLLPALSIAAAIALSVAIEILGGFPRAHL